MKKTEQEVSRIQRSIRLLAFLFTLLFAFASPAAASVLDDAKRVTIVNPSISVREALEEVKKQSGISLMYQSDIIDEKVRLNLNLKNVLLGEALDAICTPAGLQYEVEANYVLIVKAKGRRQGTPKKKITGTVIDEKGQPLMGVTIFVGGDRTRGTITDANGHYQLEASPNDLLIFSYVGMETQSITPRSDTVVNVAMQENAKCWATS